MRTFECMALQHAAEELAYQRTAQARIDLKASKLAREAADRKAGHTPRCTLMRCAIECANSTIKTK